MARRIKVTEEMKNDIIEDIKKSLDKYVTTDGVLKLTKTFDTVERRAKIHFTETAWIKMQALVATNPDEVAWHGIARRPDDTDDYYIDDIIVYPQQVSGAYVDTDQTEYTEWLMKLPDDVFHSVRMQGHSHVNMGCTPSQTDNDMYRGILNQLPDDTFYIFMIWNKRKEKWIRIFDMSKNILFETKDCDILIGTELGITKFLDDAKNLVTKRVVVQTTKEVVDDDDDFDYISPYASAYGGTYKKKWRGYKK